jgi:hypothetical protein
MDGARRIASNIAKLPTFLANIEHLREWSSRGISMVNEEWKQEFVKTGYAVVSANVQQGTYPPDKNYEAIRWLARSDPARKAYKEARDTLKNARIIARRMRIALALSAISLGLLVVAIYMLWRVLERLPN